MSLQDHIIEGRLFMEDVIPVSKVKDFLKQFEKDLEKGLMEDLKDKPCEAFAIGNWISDLLRRDAGDVLVLNSEPENKEGGNNNE